MQINPIYLCLQALTWCLLMCSSQAKSWRLKGRLQHGAELGESTFKTLLYVGTALTGRVPATGAAASPPPRCCFTSPLTSATRPTASALVVLLMVVWWINSCDTFECFVAKPVSCFNFAFKINWVASREVDVSQNREGLCVLKGEEAEGVLASSPGRVITALLLPC